ncbi:MAG: methyl-accepting chemotaxis protein [Treponema sp.]|nr:methyl-accepting chemotaxis protein [Treponema sp.]
MKKKSKMSIKQRLTLLISLLVILSSITVGAITVISSTQIVEQNTRGWMTNEAAIGAYLVSVFIQNRFDILREIASTDHMKSMDWDRQYQLLLPYTREMDFDEFAVIDLQGNARHLGGSNPNLMNREYVQRALRGETAISDIISPTAGAVRLEYPVMNYVVPIKSEGMVIGALLARTNALDFSSLITSIKARGHSYAFMVSGKGEYIAHSTRQEMILENPLELAKTNPAMVSHAGAVQRMISNTAGGNTDYIFEGTKMVCAFAHVTGYDMVLVLTAVHQSLLTEINILRNIIIIVVAVFIGAGLFVALKIAGWMSKRLKNMKKTVTRLGDGDFSQHHPILAIDEIGAIAGALNQCMDNIQHLVKTIKEKSDFLFKTGEQLSGDMIQTAEAMNQIDVNMTNVNNRMENQSASVIETSSTMRQMISSINKLSDNVESQSESVAQSSSAIEEMLANIESVTQTLVRNSESVRSLAKASDAGRGGLQEVASDIQEIARESEGLLEINSVMENIAGQTNLLSMNAAIEAAHAGEAGKGFAVVADEIRKLAESSSDQSKTISGVLKKIKESIDKITMSTNVVLEKFEDIDKGVKIVSQQEDNIRASMEEQSAGSKQILDAISNLNELTRQVKGSSLEMLEGSHQIMQESENLEQVTSEITGAMKEMSRGTSQIGSAVKRVTETASDNKDNISILVNEVGKFKVQ